MVRLAKERELASSAHIPQNFFFRLNERASERARREDRLGSSIGRSVGRFAGMQSAGRLVVFSGHAAGLTIHPPIPLLPSYLTERTKISNPVGRWSARASEQVRESSSLQVIQTATDGPRPTCRSSAVVMYRSSIGVCSSHGFYGTHGRRREDLKARACRGEKGASFKAKVR